MALPPNQRRQVDPASRKKIWLYGSAFVGKSSLADHFPDPIFLNSDGNTNSFTSPYILIKSEYRNGVCVKLAWDVFTESINELAKGNHSFKTVVVDLVEDTYEYCRVWSYNKLNIQHESDNSFKAWDFVRNRFLNAYKQLTTLPLNVVLISHEDYTRDVSKHSGDKISAVGPAIQDRVANKLAGMMDIVARITNEPNGHFINFKSDSVMFGGGRINIRTQRIPCTYEALDKIYKEQGNAAN